MKKANQSITQDLADFQDYSITQDLSDHHTYQSVNRAITSNRFFRSRNPTSFHERAKHQMQNYIEISPNGQKKHRYDSVNRTNQQLWHKKEIKAIEDHKKLIQSSFQADMDHNGNSFI